MIFFFFLFREYNIKMGLYNGENMGSGFWFSWPNYSRRGAHMRWNDSYHCAVFNFNKRGGHCIKKSHHLFEIRNYRNCLGTKPELEMLYSFHCEICNTYVLVSELKSNLSIHYCILISFRLSERLKNTIKFLPIWYSKWYTICFCLFVCV